MFWCSPRGTFVASPGINYNFFYSDCIESYMIRIKEYPDKPDLYSLSGNHGYVYFKKCHTDTVFWYNNVVL